MVYLSAFLANSGNYRGFGDQKFIPDLPKNKLEDLVTKTKAFNDNKEEMSWIWDQIKDKMYSLEKNELVLGFPPNVRIDLICGKVIDNHLRQGVTTYFSKNCTEDDSKLVKQWLELNVKLCQNLCLKPNHNSNQSAHRCLQYPRLQRQRTQDI